MIYFFNQSRIDIQNENKYQLDSDDHNYSGEYVSLDELWNQTTQEVFDKYSLPPLHLWEDGFCQGDASDEEIIKLQSFNSELVSVSKSDDELKFDFTGLDEKFIELYKEKFNNSIDQQKIEKAKEKYEELKEEAMDSFDDAEDYTGDLIVYTSLGKAEFVEAGWGSNHCGQNGTVVWTVCSQGSESSLSGYDAAEIINIHYDEYSYKRELISEIKKSL